MGFGARIAGKKEKASGELLKDIHPQDLIKFGLIPEFIGRISVISSLKELEEDDLVRILTEPKNALTRQYETMFGLDGVKLRFTQNALRAVARKAIERKTGARGLRNVLESIMLDIMYTLPSEDNVKECVINTAVVEEGKEPLILYHQEVKTA